MSRNPREILLEKRKEPKSYWLSRRLRYLAGGGVNQEIYYEKGEIHRTDGPAVINHLENGEKDLHWYSHGKQKK